MTRSPFDESWESHEAAEHLILPDGCVDIVARPSGLFMIGPMRTAKRIHTTGEAVQGMRLRPGHVRSWLGTSPQELVDQVVPLQDLRPDLEAHSLATILPHVLRHSRLCPRMQAAIQHIQHNPALSMAALATHLSWSPRHLRRQFKVEVGLAPKQFARIVRLQRLVEAFSTSDSLSDAACMAGYADQAHMNREVLRLTQETPRQLRDTMSETFKTNA